MLPEFAILKAIKRLKKHKKRSGKQEVLFSDFTQCIEALTQKLQMKPQNTRNTRKEGAECGFKEDIRR